MARRGKTTRMYALVTDQGTAAIETALCRMCFLEDEQRERVQALKIADVPTTQWHECSENDALECTNCGKVTA